MAEWTPDRLERLRGLALDGFSMAEAGRKMGCTRAAIAGAARRNDIQFECSAMRHRALCSRGLKRRWAQKRRAAA